MTIEVIPGCSFCGDPLNVSLKPELEIRRLNGAISVFKCPQCGVLVLDDIMGWKGSGVVFRATMVMIADYARKNGVPESSISEMETARSRATDSAVPPEDGASVVQ